MSKRSRSARDSADAYCENEEKKVSRKSTATRKMWFNDSDVFSRLPLTDVQKQALLLSLGCTTYTTKANPHPQKVA